MPGFFSPDKVYINSRPEVFCEKGVFRNFTKFTGKHLCQSRCFNNAADFFFRIILSGTIDENII